LSIASIPTLCVSVPVAAPTTTIGRPIWLLANSSISSSDMYSTSKPSSLSEA